MISVKSVKTFVKGVGRFAHTSFGLGGDCAVGNLNKKV